MDQDLKKQLAADPDGLLTYEYIANHIDTCAEMIDELVDNMILVDSSGQFLVSSARYLCAIDKEKFADAINRLVAVAIEKDRERRYLADLLPTLWGADYTDHIDELIATDDNFRRIYKRLYPTAGM
ncbi:MAG: hypothetical protein NC098_02075 [Lachnoclostridium sp.]|nr:hypothetical protein [Lachnoclostridium sp.]